MTQEEKQLLLIDLSARQPYGVKCRAAYSKFPTTLVGVNTVAVIDDDFIATVKLEKTGKNSPSLIEDIKPYLRPMSSMTLEERIELKAITHGSIQTIGLEDIVVTTDKGFDYLNAHHFDYRGLIPMGLAIEATEGMYKTE